MMRCLCMGETLLRYSTPKGIRIRDLSFSVHVGGSETNIAVSLANFGFESALFSKISNNDLGDAIIHFLHGFHVSTKNIIRCEGRVGSYFLEVGSGNRPSKVVYDRANATMTTLSRTEIDIPSLCKGIDVFIVSGITMALSKEIQMIVIEIMKYCKEHDICVVYDSNYRAKLWSQEEAGKALHKVLSYVDILSVGVLDAKYLLQLETQKEGYIEQLLDYYQQIYERYRNIKYMTSTKRDILSNSVNDLQGFIYNGKEMIHSNRYHIDDIVDRVGGGDAFIAGIIYGLLNNKDLLYTVNFGCSASVLKHTIYGDVNSVNVEEIEAYMKEGTSSIQR